MPVDGNRFAGELVSIDPDGQVTFRVAGEEAASKTRTLPLTEFVRWGHPVEPRPQTLVLLDDGLVAAANWSGGAPVRLDGDRLTVPSAAFDEVIVPRPLVRGIVFAQRHHPEARERLAKLVRSMTREQDTLLLTNGDELRGELTKLGRGSLGFSTEAGIVDLPLSRVAAWASDGRASLPPRAAHAPFVLGLRDGSLLHASSATTTTGALDIRLLGDIQCSGGSIADIVFLQSLTGPFVYLSDFEPAAYRHVPYLDIEWPYQRDRSVASGPLVVGGKRYLKGVGMHAASRLTYRLKGKYRRFDAAVAIDDTAEGRGSVTFGVYVLRDGEWQEAFKSVIVRGGDPPQPVSVDVSGTNGLTLTVDYADRGDELDRAAWLDARLIKE